MNKIVTRFIISVIIIQFAFQKLDAQRHYNDYKSVQQMTRSFSEEYPSLCSVRSLVKTAGGKEIWIISIGSGNRDSKPGIAIFGGVEGNHLLGREMALGFAGSLLRESSSQEIKILLDKITFYVFPDVNPDASEQFFSDLKYERMGNARSTDDDRDFLLDEDGFEDLNKDGLITLIRVSDQAGKFIKSNEDERVMVEADISGGQTGKYNVYPEGIDNDNDGGFNEDGPGGVDFNRNFTFSYEAFGLRAGMYPVSELETRAVADFLFDKFNIYSVIVFGPQDNLAEPWKSAPGSDSGKLNGPDGVKIIKSVMKEDEAICKLVSDKYHEITGVKGAPVQEPCYGNFAEWAYFHYGRYSFSTPAWWFSAEKGKNAGAEFLKYAEKNNIGDVFVPWTTINHPDFPGKITEVGGIKPFAMWNPPADSLENIIARNFKFIKAVASMHPELEFLDLKSENIGEGIYRISLKLHNRGIFATCAKSGEENLWTRIMRISIEPSKGQSILSGQKIQNVGRLEGGQSAGFSWLISGKGSVRINAGALNTGTATSTIELR
jgi:hypothetical protein